jgi:hypothetical protein
MIRGGASERGEDGVGEDHVPGKVDERTIETFKGRIGSPIRPSILTINKRELDQGEIVDSINEVFGFTCSEMIIVFFMSELNHIKVATNKPRNPIGGSNLFELFQEGGSELRNRGSIDIRNADGEIGGSFRQEDREGRWGSVVVSEREKRVVPRRQEATRGPRGRMRATDIQGTGQEGRELRGGEFRQLSFLQQHQVGRGGKQLSKNITVFLGISKPTNIPKTKGVGPTHDPLSTPKGSGRSTYKDF